MPSQAFVPPVGKDEIIATPLSSEEDQTGIPTVEALKRHVDVERN